MLAGQKKKQGKILALCITMSFFYLKFFDVKWGSNINIDVFRTLALIGKVKTFTSANSMWQLAFFPSIVFKYDSNITVCLYISSIRSFCVIEVFFCMILFTSSYISYNK